MKKNFFYLLSVLYLFSATKIYAVCPVCTVAVGVGVGISRKYGVDDTIAGIWVGALLVSTSMWTLNWLKSKKWRFYADSFIVPLLYFGITLIPMYKKNVISQKIIGDHFQTLWGVDKLLLGIIVGSLAFLAAASVYELIKRKNGKPHFPFEKVVLPVTTLACFSILFYFLTK